MHMINNRALSAEGPDDAGEGEKSNFTHIKFVEVIRHPYGLTKQAFELVLEFRGEAMVKQSMCNSFIYR